MDPERFELSTFSMPLRRAPNCAMGPYLIDACGLLIADYRCACPITNLQSAIPTILVDLERFELSTSSVRLRRAPNCATGPFMGVGYST